MSDAAAPDQVAATLAALRIEAVDGAASVVAEGYPVVSLCDTGSRAEDTALRRLLVHVLEAGVGRAPTERTLKSARDRLEQRIQAARDQARAQRGERDERHEREQRQRALAIQAKVQSGDRLGALEIHLGDAMAAVRRVAGVAEDASLSSAVAAFASARDLEDGPDAAVALVAEATEEPGADNNPQADNARRILGLPVLEHGTDVSACAPQESRYEMRPEGIVHLKQVEGGEVPVLVATFTARIVREVVRDDGSGVPVLVFDIEATVDGRTASVQVHASKFALMSWPTELLGSRACVSAGATMRDRAREAIQRLSGKPPRETIYTHAGWRDIDGVRAYLHAAGAIGPQGPLPGVQVELPAALAHHALPNPPSGAALHAAVRASMELLDVASDNVTVLSLGIVFRTVVPFGSADCSGLLLGGTGRLKTSLGVVLLSFFGSAITAENLPTWTWTPNALEALLFAAKDMLTLVDDAAPDGSPVDRQRMWGTVQRVVRAQAGQSGRGRSAQDGSLRGARHPRGSLLITAEDTPPGESILPRAVLMEVPARGTPGGVDLARLTRAQAAGRAGLHAQTMAAFVQHLAQDPAGAAARADATFQSWRTRLSVGATHLRTPSNLAQVAVGWEEFLHFAVLAGALSQPEAAALRARVGLALERAVGSQNEQQAATDQIERFRRLTLSALGAGQAHVANMSGDDPTGGEGGLGWRKEERPSGSDTATVLKAHGQRIGWIEGGNLYLEPETAVRVANAAAGMFGEGVAVKPKTLGRRLAEAGLLASKDADGRNTVRRTIEGAEQRVLHLRADFLRGASDAGAAGQSELPLTAAHGLSAACASCGAETPEKGVAYSDCSACRAALKSGGAA